MAVDPFDAGLEPRTMLGDAGSPDVVSGRPLESELGLRVHAVAHRAKITATVNEPRRADNQENFESRASGMATSDTMLLRAGRRAVSPARVRPSAHLGLLGQSL